jgi:hypothetical protein
MKHLSLLLLLFFAAGAIPAQGPWSGLQRLTGTWKLFGKPVFEKWEASSPDTLAGEGYSILEEGKKQTSEYLRIVRLTEGGIVYQATVPEQNGGATINFPLTFFTASSWTFENPEHDFPQTIEYWLQDDETLRATISGAGSSIVLWFNRATSEQTKIQPTLRGYDLFVSSRNTGTVERYDAFTGQYKSSFGKEQIGSETQDLSLGPDGMLYVVSLSARSVLKFDPTTGAFLGNFTTGFDLRNPVKLTFGPDGFLYVSQWGDGQGSVLRFNTATGRFDRDMTGPLAGPVGHAWDAAGNLYVACFHSKDVRKFPADGQFPGVVSPPGSLQGPSALWFAPDGDLLVADLDHVSIKRFRPEGAAFAYRGAFADGFGRLEGVALGPDGFLYACDARMNLVKKLEADSGISIGVYLEGGSMQGPNGLVFWKR